jgi:DNA ligase (NAD+)
LEKARTEGDLRDFYERLVREGGLPEPVVCVEPKIDGMAVSLIYVDGRFDRALTRGNGQSGKDITRNVRAIEGFPESLMTVPGEVIPRYLELRGELTISAPDFERLNGERIAAGQTPFSTERNLAAGTALSGDADLVRQRKLRLACFDWGAWEPQASAPASQTGFLNEMRSWGLPVVESFGTASGIDALLELVKAASKAAAESPLPLDGLVLKVDDTGLRERLGTGPESPNWALAYKFPAEEVVTELLDVTYQVARTGRLSPVAELRPVTIDGREISRASLHNWTFIREHDLRLGDQLVIHLSGDVIPRLSGLKAAASAPDSRPIAFPENCPECGKAIDFSKDLTTGYCRSGTCPGRLREQLAYFGQVLGIRGLGPETAGQLVEAGLVTTPADLYRLRAQADLVFETLGEGLSDKLMAAIEPSRKASLELFIEALGIPGIGPAGAAIIAGHFQSWEALLDWNPGDNSPGLPELDRRQARLLGEYLADSANRSTVTQLAAVLSSSAQEDSGPGPSPAAYLPADPI